MNKYKIKTAIEDFVYAVLVIFTFFVFYYLITIPNKTIEQVVFLCVFIGMVVWITALKNEKFKLQVALLKRLRANLLFGLAYKEKGYKNGERDLIMDVLYLLGCPPSKPGYDAEENAKNWLKKFNGYI